MSNQNNNTNTKLEQALWYRTKLNWSVIPIGKDKRPLIAWKKYQNVLPSIEEINNWFKKFPEANVGIVTGKVSNLVVVDIDPRHGGNNEHFKLIKTITSKTGGGGWHYYFQYEIGVNNSTGIALGIDVRGEGGYVIAPPSLHSSGESYKWEVG